jgi:hypothetical protein
MIRIIELTPLDDDTVEIMYTCPTKHGTRWGRSTFSQHLPIKYMLEMIQAEVETGAELDLANKPS